jgi:hypothetical protein
MGAAGRDGSSLSSPPDVQVCHLSDPTGFRTRRQAKTAYDGRSVRGLLGSRGPIQPPKKGLRPELGEDVPRLFGYGGVPVIGAEERHEVQFAEGKVERALGDPDPASPNPCVSK